MNDTVASIPSNACTSSTVLAEVVDGVGVLTLNRPKALNALSLEMVRTMYAQLSLWAEDNQVRAVLVRGAGDKAFCAGGDIRALHDSYQAGDGQWLRFFEEEYALDLFISEYPKPYVALMDGYTMGGGMGIGQPATLRIVTGRTRMAMPEVGIGYFPDVGGSFFLPRLPGFIGFYLGMTGVQIGPADALFAGLADVCIPSADVADMPALIARMHRIPWHRPPPQRLHGWTTPTDIGEPPLAAFSEPIAQHFGQRGAAAIVASLRTEQRPQFQQWARDTLELIGKRSPLAVAVTWELLSRGSGAPLEDCLRLELALDRAWLPRGDLIEGVRALLVDKDHAPRWNPPTLEQVDEPLIQSFFEPAAVEESRHA
ncbi:enoyl-CoA hydratase/isomerase family protein [Xylophilus sp. GOD-11R]|uniref:enoyl-CoA hydratase/isomerase family protein n=1 Tax=Xylophilus sp. GOD-11R TaxID=3089814 RepID=UPI00298C640A|nr:enoyl-CoA hydratase/isomerase family protein [Xylophilus sp. GOD-11R]WPB56555.1 enoyl-CoA hydratase/isomerase family protein [Xylophilus sp. GOD-11R]